MQRMRIVRGGAAVNRCVSVSSLKLLNNLQLFSMSVWMYNNYKGLIITVPCDVIFVYWDRLT